MKRSKAKLDNSKFEYLAGETTVILDVDRIESAIEDRFNKRILIKMHSGDEFCYENEDEGEIIEAYWALTSKFRSHK